MNSAVRSIGVVGRGPKTVQAAPSVGRAVVTAVEHDGVTVALADGSEVCATFALALPYTPCAGDVLLVVRGDEGDETFVIGVIAGRGKTSLAIQGSVALHAIGGQLDLSGDQGVLVRGPIVEVHADKLRTVANSVVESFVTLFQRVTDVLHVHARQQVSIVDEDSYQQAKTAAIQTEDVVTINGKEIHLG